MAVDASGIPLGAVRAPANAATTRRCWCPHPGGYVRGAGGAVRGGERPPRPRQLRLAPDPRASGGTGAELGDLGEAQAGAGWGHQEMGGGEDELVAQRPQDAGLVHGAGRGRVIDFWVAFSDVVIVVRRLAREGWTRYRWEGRPSRRP